MRVFVGRSAFRSGGNIMRYAERFDMLEVRAEPAYLPRRARLAEWRSEVPTEFVFAALVPAEVATFQEGASAERALGYAESVADALDVRWWVLQTPIAVTPGARARRQLSALAERLGRSGRRVAWEPRGVWSAEEAQRLALDVGIHLVRDAARETLPPSNIVYTRLRALGTGANISADAAERVAERLQDVEEAYVIVEGSGAQRLRQIILEEMGQASADEDPGPSGEEDVDGDVDEALEETSR